MGPCIPKQSKELGGRRVQGVSTIRKHHCLSTCNPPQTTPRDSSWQWRFNLCWPKLNVFSSCVNRPCSKDERTALYCGNTPSTNLRAIHPGRMVNDFPSEILCTDLYFLVLSQVNVFDTGKANAGKVPRVCLFDIILHCESTAWLRSSGWETIRQLSYVVYPLPQTSGKHPATLRKKMPTSSPCSGISSSHSSPGKK